MYNQDDCISPLKNLCNSLFLLWLPFFNIWIQKRMHPDVCQVSFLDMYNFYNFKMNISLCTLIQSGFLFFIRFAFLKNCIIHFAILISSRGDFTSVIRLRNIVIETEWITNRCFKLRKMSSSDFIRSTIERFNSKNNSQIPRFRQ